MSQGNLLNARIITQSVYKPGKSPYIDPITKTWWVFDDKKQEYVDTGVYADASASIIIDDELSEESENPVQNKVVTIEVNSKVNNTEMKSINAIDIDMLWENIF